MTSELRLSPTELPPAVLTISRELAANGYKAWLVGGSVRDSLLAQLRGDVPSGHWVAKEWDIATDAEPRDVMRVFRRVVPTGIDHGTVTVLIGKEAIEVTTLRAETTYSDGRRPDRVDFVRSIEDDLSRRDFTVNAIAVEPDSGAIIDPFAGVTDLQRQRLRAVGEPARRFAEDGLRVLRAARFVASLGFELDADTASAIRPSLDTYRKVSPERIRDEWVKALKATAPSRAFRIMLEHGLLDITAPELARSSDLPHAFARVDATPIGLELRLAALLAALERAHATDTSLADALLVRLRFSNAEKKRVTSLLAHFPVQYLTTWSDADVRRWLQRSGVDLYADLCRLQQADLKAYAPAHEDQLRLLAELEHRAHEVLAEKPPLSLADLAVNGRTLMTELGVKPGRALGEALQKLLDVVVADPTQNTPERLLENARELLAAQRESE